MPRAGYAVNEAYLDGLREEGARVIYLEELSLPHVSATAIRAALVEGEGVEGLVEKGWLTAEVAYFIQKQMLYRKNAGDLG